MATSPTFRRACRQARRLAAIAAMALLGVSTGATPAAHAAPAALALPAQAGPSAPTGVRFLDDVFDEVEVSSDVPYREAVNASGDLQTLHMEIYEPAGDTAERRPVVMLMHGGFFVIGNHQDDRWGAGPRFAEAFALKGFVAVSIQYRLRPDMGFFPNVDLTELEAANLDAYDDSVAAVEWLRDHADELRIDPRAIVANGPSAGGSMAWNLAWMQGSALRPEPSGVAAAVSVSGAPFETAVGTGEPLAAASPGDRPVIAFHGTADGIVAFELAAGPCGRAAAAGVRCDLVPYEGIGHPAIDPRFVNLFDDIERRTVEFIAEVVLAPLGYLDQAPADLPTAPTVPTAPTAPSQSPPGPAQALPAQPVVVQPTFTG
jgi:acetyl esterase/lipase